MSMPGGSETVAPTVHHARSHLRHDAADPEAACASGHAMAHGAETYPALPYPATREESCLLTPSGALFGCL
jgi:hypothetical protein